MHIRLVIPLAILCLSALEVASSWDVWQLAQANGMFAFKLYNKLTATENGNIFISPFSISTALAMTYAGASNPTKSQMGGVLGFTPCMFNVPNTFHTTLELLNMTQGQYTLTVANRLFAQQRFNIRQSYKDILSSKYLAGLDVLDFAGNPSAAATFINQWVKTNTNNKIRNIVDTDAVANALLVLANAIYFKGFWDISFDPKLTTPGTFHSSPSTTVDMMSLGADFAYSENNYLKCKILGLPYKGGRLAMYVFLPNSRSGLASLEKKINFESVTSALARLQKQKIAVTFPKFKMTLGLQLKEILKAMGMTHAFNTLDFKGIATDGGLRIGQVIHKAFIQVDERGTEAAAATVVTTYGGSRPTMFVADHPFLFLIRDNLTGSILFLGRLVKP